MGRGRRFPCIGSKAQRTAFEKSELSMLILRERRSSDDATPAGAFPFNRQSHTPPPKAGGVTPPGSRVDAGESAERKPEVRRA
jgi:hypothetical protein